MESAKYTLKKAVQAIQELDFGEDSLTSIHEKRMQNNDIFEIVNIEKQDILPVVYHMLQNCQPTSASAERSFFMEKRLWAKGRNFKIENVRHYMILHINAFIWFLLACRANYVPKLDLFCNSLV